MKFIGFMVGLLIGAMLGSAPAAILLGFAGAFLAHHLYGKKALPSDAESPSLPPALDNADAEWSGPPDARDLALLIDKVATLEARVATLETALSKGGGVPEADAVKTPAKEAQVPVAVPVPVFAVPAVAAAASAERSIVVAASMPAEVAASPQASIAVQPPVVPTLAPIPAPNPTPAQASIPAPQTQPQPTQPTPQPTPPSTVRPAPPPVPPSIPWRERLPKPLADLVFGGNMLVKMGALILFLGLAFLLRYTAERVTVPIELRYASVALVGAALLALGWVLRRRRPDYAIVLQGAGIGVFYLTTLAAMKLHALLPAMAGFAFLFGVAVLAAVLAVLQNAPVLAIVAALEGFAAPVLASTGANNPVGLFTYLLVLDVGIFLVAWFKAWRVLNLIGAVGTFTLAAGWAQKYYTDDQFGTVQPFLLVFFVLFVAVGFLFARRTLLDIPAEASAVAAGAGSESELESELESTSESDSLASRAAATLRRVGRVDSALAFGVPMAAFGLQYLMVQHWDMGAAFAALGFAAFYLLLGKWTWSTQPRGLALLAEAYAIVGVIFATLAIPLGLEGQWTGAAWAVEAAGMYWLGVRQQRPYARAFAFVVLAGAIAKLLQATHVDGAPGHALIAGSFIGPLLVATGAFAMWALHRRAKLDSGGGKEALAGLSLPWLGMASLTLLLWQAFLPGWAAMATAVLASATFALATRFSWVPLIYVTYGMQTLAVASFIATLHRGSGEQVLASGLDGMWAALGIAASVLSSVAWAMRRVLQEAAQKDVAPHWRAGNVLAVLTGVGLLHLAMLFQITAAQAALIWPLSASLALWLPLRIGHPALALQAAALHGVAGFLVATHTDSLGVEGTFSGLGFWSACVMGLAALWCGDQLRGTSRTRNPWSGGAGVLWLPVVWGLFWALRAVLWEATSALQNHALYNGVPSMQVAIVLVSSALCAWVATRRAWSQLARATVATLPVWLLITAVGWSGWGPSATVLVPSDGFGWLVWPLALAWHLRLLAWQEQWFDKPWLARLHVVGFWFFVLVAARECQWLLGNLGDDWSSWSLLGWMLAPALALWGLQLPALLARWPLRAYQQAYVTTAAVPVVLYLLAWVWLSNVASPGNADPLPFVPLLNPLELAHWLVLGALLAWWRRAGPSTPVAPQLGAVLGGLTALALLTGMVLRGCHHFADISWDADSLYASRLAQAALSITWALCAVALMGLGHAKVRRTLWIAGAALLGTVVLKLFLIELADQGGLFRIVSFLSVGVLLLAVGYFAPVPPAKVVAPDAPGGAA